MTTGKAYGGIANAYMAAHDSSMTIYANCYRLARISLRYWLLIIVFIIKKPAYHKVVAG
jgi:hypothetical protein